MVKFFEKVEQKGTLLVEAIAMLGLIAMVTPTLYKKSTERMLEIQDINAASQARIMNDIVETFVKSRFTQIGNAILDSSNTNHVIKLCENDNTPGCFVDGYSSYMPFGYQPGNIKNYGEPEVYVHKDGDSFVSYIVFPHIADPGKKRAARLASLVGANGGFVNKVNNRTVFQGTGGAWYLDSAMIEQMAGGIFTNVPENSLVITANEPIEKSTEDNYKYIYRGKHMGEHYHNTMVTDLFMGGHSEDGDWRHEAQEYYGIFNTRKLLLNTKCTGEQLKNREWDSSCNPEVADLYVGKPFDTDGIYVPYEQSGGAAWIYGNLRALNESFGVFKPDSSSAPRLVFGDKTSGSSMNYPIVEAYSDYGSAEVGLLNNFIRAKQNNINEYEFLVGAGDNIDVDRAMFYGSSRATDGRAEIHIARAGSSNVYINEQGGNVWINGSSETGAIPTTYVNTGGGILKVGANQGEWLSATEKGSRSTLDLLSSGGTFKVGSTSTGASSNVMIFADSSQIALRGERLQIYKENSGLEETATNPLKGDSIVDGVTNIATKYTDLLGSIFVGNTAIGASSDAVDNGAHYTRAGYRLGVAGSAWIDGYLWAREAWLKKAGMHELHAGFDSFEQYANRPRTGWLNVYNSSDGGVYVRNAGTLTNSADKGSDSDTMLIINSSQVTLRMPGESSGANAVALMELDDDGTFLGKGNNFFGTNKGIESGKGSSFVIAEEGITISTTADSSYVDMQGGALYIGGRPGNSSTEYPNVIKAKAREFTLDTIAGSTAVSEEFLVNDNLARTRAINFEVQRADSTNVFAVNTRVSSSDAGIANVTVDGSVHISGNDVFYVSNKEENSSRTNSDRALFEVDPRFVRIWAKDNGSFAGDSSSIDYYAMVEIDTTDVDGTRDSSRLDNASIYIRKGAMEFQKSRGNSSLLWEADEGFGYIKANRFVSNADTSVPVLDSSNVGVVLGSNDTRYDQYMVNPAYTSVMHDIKLTTRGNARLSDILPDYVLKGVYNVSNDHPEGKRSDGERVDGTGAWADPYLGKIPYPMCPPGYKKLATVVPISFQIGRTGRAVKSEARGGMNPSGKWMIDPQQMQIDTLKTAISNGMDIEYTDLQEVSSVAYYSVYNTGSSGFSTFVSDAEFKTEGWFRGIRAKYPSESSHMLTTVWHPGSSTVPSYEYNGKSFLIPEPLYFQEGTFLKTSLDAQTSAWDAYMGFIYDVAMYGKDMGGIEAPVNSNNTTNDGGMAASSHASGGLGYVWNLFPIPTNTLEGHATVYCFFDRNSFDSSYVLRYNPKDNDYDYTNKVANDKGGYIDRLDDPTLKYRDPW